MALANFTYVFLEKMVVEVTTLKVPQRIVFQPREFVDVIYLPLRVISIIFDNITRVGPRRAIGSWSTERSF